MFDFHVLIHLVFEYTSAKGRLGNNIIQQVNCPVMVTPER